MVSLFSCTTVQANNKEVKTMYLVKYENNNRVYNHLRNTKFKNDPRSFQAYILIHNLINAKFYPPVNFVGKIIIDDVGNSIFYFIDKEEQSKIEALYKEKKQTGFEYTIYYKEKPVKYPRYGNLEEYYIFWRWTGTLTYEDKEFVEAFIDKYLFNCGYAMVENEIGKKYYQLLQVTELTEGELLNATILQKGEVIYKNTGNYDEWIKLKENPYRSGDPAPQFP